jgi:hypothetical protein
MNSKFKKRKRPIDYVGLDHIKAIREVFENTTLSEIEYELRYWFYIAISNETSTYVDTTQRGNMVQFYHDLQNYLDAVSKYNNSHQLSSEQFQYNCLIIKRFCVTYDLSYARIELHDLLDSVISYEGRFTDNISTLDCLNYHLNILCLVEAGHIITNQTEQ